MVLELERVMSIEIPTPSIKMEHFETIESVCAGWSERLMAGLWLRAGSVAVRRQEPVATKAGKILPFHVSQH